MNVQLLFQAFDLRNGRQSTSKCSTIDIYLAWATGQLREYPTRTDTLGKMNYGIYRRYGYLRVPRRPALPVGTDAPNRNHYT